jgi:hypothetical protein
MFSRNIVPAAPANHRSSLLSALNTLFSTPGAMSDALKVLLLLRLEKIGRSNAGKSALEWALIKTIVSNFFPSGLQLDAENPQLVAELIEKDRNIRARLENDPLLPTTEATPIRYLLYEGEIPRLCLASHEVIGQVLLNTKPNSPPEWKAKYQEYTDRLSMAHVIWVVQPVPPVRATAADNERFETDLKVTVSYLREALKLRTSDMPVVVALVLTRGDSRYDDAVTAQRELTDEVLIRSLTPLVTLVRMSGKVSEAAIFLTSAYGFGNAVRRTDVPKNGDATVVQQDGQWTLKSDAHVVPFNLDALAAWTLYQGLYEQKVDEEAPEVRPLGRVLELLKYDLDNCGGWIVPVKSRHDMNHHS